MTTLIEWIKAGAGNYDRTAKIMWLEPSGLWLAELSTVKKPYCPGRSPDFEEAVRLAIKSASEDSLAPPKETT